MKKKQEARKAWEGVEKEGRMINNIRRSLKNKSEYIYKYKH